MIRAAAVVLSIVISLIACAPAPRVLHVHRYTEASSVSRFAPLDRTLTDPVAVDQLYSTVLALPQKQPGDYFCPISFGLRYRLTFDAGPKATRVVIVEGDGCRLAHLSGGTERVTTESFWAQLAGALGFSTRGNEIFPLPLDLAR